MQIRLATYADKDTWDDYVLRHPDGSAYQLFAWREAIEETYSFKGPYLLAEDESGIRGILPLVDFRVPLIGRTLISLPYCDAGGVLADNQQIEQVLIKYACSMAEEIHAGLKLRSTRSLLSCGENQTDKVSMVLDLPDHSESLLASYKSSLRSQINKPTRDGLTVMVGQGELVDEFYAVFAENMRDLGSPVHARLWLQSVVSSYADRVRVAVVYTPDKVPAAAGVILLHGLKASVPWASSLRRYNSQNPNMLLYWTLLSLATENGCSHFDFGRSTPGEGTYRFKRQWGAEPRSLYWYEINGSKIASNNRTKNRLQPSVRPFNRRQLATRIWQKLPQSGTDWLGPKLRKYISL